MVECIKREDAINLLWLYADESCASFDIVTKFSTVLCPHNNLLQYQSPKSSLLPLPA